jgi:predicted transposase/invertase (TIGR01784 family)
MRYLDPKNDLTFKKIFGQHSHLLKSFLNGVLPFETEEEEIETLEYLTGEQVPDIPLFKNTIVDVKCKDKKGRQFIVEMQLTWTDSFKSRVLFNASKAYVRQLDKGKKYENLQPVYALNIVNEVFSDKESYYHHYKIVNIEDTKEQLKGLEFIFIELPKFSPSSISLKKMGILWLRFLSEIDEKTDTISKDLMNQNEIKEAIEYLQESSFSKQELEYYDTYWDSVSREKTLTYSSEAKGQEREKITRIKKIIEQNLLSISQIAQLFEVSEDFVLKIKNDMN